MPAVDETSLRARPPRRFLVGGAVVVLLIGGLVWAAREMSAEHDAAVTELGDAVVLNETLSETLQLLVDGETAQRGYALTGDPTFLEPLRESRARLPDALDSLGPLLAAKNQQVLAGELRSAIEDRAEFTEQVVSLMEDGDRDGARELVATREGKRRMDRVRSLVTDARLTQQRATERAIARVDAARSTAVLLFVALISVTAALFGALVLSVRRDREHAAIALAQSREEAIRFRTLAESSTDLVRIEAPDGAVLFTNAMATTLLGYAPSELESLSLTALLPEEDREPFRASVAAAGSKTASSLAHRLTHKDGSLRLFTTRIEVVRDADGNVLRREMVSRDTTNAAREREQLEALAERDELTGLLNRRAFVARATAMMGELSKSETASALFFCDVNGLKTINDTLGHEAGDGVIRDAATVLVATARTADIVARLGGDEFVVFGAVRDAAAGDAFRTRLRERIAGHNRDAGRKYRVSISVGTTFVAPGDARDLPAIIAAADREMYAAKRQRREQGTSMEILRDGEGEDA